MVLADGAADLCEVLRGVGAGDPIEVREELDHLLAARCVPGASATGVTPRKDLQHSLSNEADLAVVCSYLGELGVPHPADYDWRFSPSTIIELADNHRASCIEGRTALLGTPTLLPLLRQRGHDVVLFDLSRSTIDDLKRIGFERGLFTHDLFGPTSVEEHGQFEHVVGDPPWYPEFLHTFVLRSAELLEVGGLLSLSVMPLLTRPTAEAEREELLRFAASVGLNLIGVEGAVLKYDSPPFEKRVLDRQGIHCDSWRRGDLFLFRKDESVSLANLVVRRPRDEPIWIERRVGGVKIKVREGDEETQPGGMVVQFEPAGVSPFYDSFSRRSPDRSRVDVWSSNGRAFAVKGLRAVRYCLRVLETRTDTRAAAERASLRGLASPDSRAVLERLLITLIDEGH